MNTAPHDDPQLRARFRALRAADEGQVPGFDATWAAAAARSPTQRAPWPRPAWTGAAAVLLALLWLMRPAAIPPAQPTLTSNPPAPVLPTSIAQWRAPSDALLHTADLHLWRDLPRLGAPLPGWTTPINEES